LKLDHQVVFYDINRRKLKELHRNGFNVTLRIRDAIERQNYFIFNLLWQLKLAALDAYIELTKDTRPPVLDK